MRIRKQYKLDKCVRTDAFSSLRHAYLDVDESHVVVTDGHCMAIVPCTVQEGDTSGMISIDALKDAQKHATKEKKGEPLVGEISCNGALKVERGATHKRPMPTDKEDPTSEHEMGPYVPYKQAMVDYNPFDDDVVEIGLNARLLYDLAQALGRDSHDARVRLRIKITKDMYDPIQVSIDETDDQGNAHGFLMPVRL